MVKASVMAAILALSTCLDAQSGPFQFVIAVSDAAGNPVVDLTRDDVLMSEDGVAAEVIKLEPFHLPVTLTIAVDNRRAL